MEIRPNHTRGFIFRKVAGSITSTGVLNYIAYSFFSLYIHVPMKSLILDSSRVTNGIIEYVNVHIQYVLHKAVREETKMSRFDLDS
jgi:hypothetical protein